MESSNQRRDTVVTDLSELTLGEPAPPVMDKAATSRTIPLLVLYRGLFTHIPHMERDRVFAHSRETVGRTASDVIEATKPCAQFVATPRVGIARTAERNNRRLSS